jgi:hypothetical protein
LSYGTRGHAGEAKEYVPSRKRRSRFFFVLFPTVRQTFIFKVTLGNAQTLCQGTYV